MEDDVCEVYENERYYGVTWRTPALLDRPKWSNASGELVILPQCPTEGSPAWELELTHKTDFEGWQYGSVFKHLEYPRPGGRAEKRVGDFVRRRRWIRTGKNKFDEAGSGTAEALAQTANAVAHSLISPVTQMQGSKVRKQTEMDRRKSSLRIFFGMLTNTFKRRQLWSLLPMDPSAWYFMLTKHQSELVASQTATLASSPLILGPSKPASGKGGDSGPSTDSADLVRQLVCAAVHSKAAYGHAMAAGHLSSLYNFALLQTLHQLNFNPVGGASGEANNEAVAALAGIPVEDIWLAEWHNSVMRPCHYLAIDRSNHCIVLAIRGSLETGDVLMDLTAKPMEVFGLLGTQGLVHEGMMSAATYIQCNTGPALASLAKELPGWPLVITGHSMGGSVATILALLIRKTQGDTLKELGPVRCIAIGPAPVFSKPLAEACNSFVTSIIHGGDVVPRISYASVEGSFLEFANSSTIGTLKRRVTETLEGLKVDWYPQLKSSLQHPHIPHIPSLQGSLPSMSGLASLVGLADDDKANANAARAAETAANIATCLDIEMQPPGTTESKADGGKASSAPVSKIPAGSYIISDKLTKENANSAVKKLAKLRGKSCGSCSNKKHEAEAAAGASQDESDREAAADILQTEGQEFRDESGNPEPLYVAGRVLWMIPAKEAAAAASEVPSAAQLSSEIHLDSLTSLASMADGQRDANSREANSGKEGNIEQAQKDAGSVDWSKLDKFSTEGNEQRAEQDEHFRRSPAQKRPHEPSEAKPGRTILQQSSSFPSLAVYEEADSHHSPATSHLFKRPRSNDSEPTVSSGAKEKEISTARATKGVPSVYEVERDEFGKILLTMEMLQDHLPSSYLDSINQL